MTGLSKQDRRLLELMLIVIAVGMTFLLWRMGAYKMVILNLFFLPIVLSGYFLGRTSAGILALFSVLMVTVAATIHPVGFAAFDEPVMVGLALTVWGGSLGLTAILVGTLCDDRAKTVDDLHIAYIGVVEVLTKYLQSADSNVKARSIRIAELSQDTAEEMKLSRKDVDDVRVAALLHDLGNVEITTQLLNKAVGTLKASGSMTDKYTFSGTELVQSLGSVLKGAVPLLLSQDDALHEYVGTEGNSSSDEVPTGARIIRTVRAYDALTTGDSGETMSLPEDVLQELRKDVSGGYSPEVLDAIERVARRSSSSTPLEPAYT